MRDRIFRAIEAERERQDDKFGEQNHDPFKWLAILGEEVGEANKAALEAEFALHKGFDGSGNFENYIKELIQIAAVAVSMIECFQRNAPKLNFLRDLFLAYNRRRGLLKKYNIQKADGSPVDPRAEYFVLRLDKGQKDKAHYLACRAAIREYAILINAVNPELSKALKERYLTE